MYSVELEFDSQNLNFDSQNIKQLIKIERIAGFFKTVRSLLRVFSSPKTLLMRGPLCTLK